MCIRDRENLDYKILVGHLTVEGATIGPRIRYISYDDPPIPKRMLRPDFFDYIALGHIHKPQKLDGNICYSGSVEKIDFSEELEDKSFWIFNLADGTIKEYPIKCRPMKTIEVNIPPLTQPISAIESSLSNISNESIIRLILRGETGLVRRILEKINALENLLFNRFKIIGYKLEFEYYTPVTLRDIDVERLDFSKILSKYIRSRYRGRKAEVIDKAIKYGLEMFEK